MNSTETLSTTVLATVEPQALNGVLSHLKNMQGVTFYTAATGRFDIVIQLNTTEQAKVYSLVSQIRAIEGIITTRTLIPFQGFTNGAAFKQGNSLATVLLGVNGQLKNVLQTLQKTPSVLSAFVVPGEFDVVATLYGNDYNSIFTQVMKIGQIQGITASETLFAYKPVWA